MQWRVMVELSSADGSVQAHEVHVEGCLPAACSAETLGLTRAQAKQLLAELQRHLVQAQMEEYCRSRRRCPRCGAQRPLKDRRPRQLRSLFGIVTVHAPRFAACRCNPGHCQTLSPVGEIMPDRCTPEYERTLAEMGAQLPNRRARALLDDLLPLGTPSVVETIRQRTLRVGARLECQAATPSRSTPAVAAGSITLSNDNGQQLVFTSVPDEACHQAQQLRGVLHDLGATQTTPVTILSDGAEGSCAVGEACQRCGAHLMLKVRTAVMNGTFDRDHAGAEWRAKRPYRRRAA